MARAVIVTSKPGTAEAHEAQVIILDEHGLRAFGSPGPFAKEAAEITRMGRTLTAAEREEEFQRFADRGFNGYSSEYREIPMDDGTNVRKVNALIREWSHGKPILVGKSISVAERQGIEFKKVRDGDGDGRVYDGTTRERPALPNEMARSPLRTPKKLRPKRQRRATSPFRTPSAYFKNPKPTYDFYRDENGNLRPEREALHRQILNSVHQSAEKYPKRRHAVFMGGGPGSGKGTVSSSGKIPGERLRLDPDGFKLMLPEYEQLRARGNRSASVFVHDEGSEIFDKTLEELPKDGVDLTIDTTGDRSYDLVESRVSKLKQAGYTVDANYVLLPPEEGVRRGRARGDRDGRMVPEAYAHEVYNNIPKIITRALREQLFDSLRLWDNRGNEPTEILTFDRNGLRIINQQALKDLLGTPSANEIIALGRTRRKADAGRIQLGQMSAKPSKESEQTVSVNGMAKMIRQISMGIPFEQAGWPPEVRPKWDELNKNIEDMRREGKIVDLAD